jgi:peroxiredoxin
MNAIRTLFLIDPQGMVRKKWVLANPSTDVGYSGTVLKDIREVIGEP